jgi:hypothetical protein
VRYIATPYVYDKRNRPVSWSVWDKKKRRWAKSPCYGTREAAEREARNLESLKDDY